MWANAVPFARHGVWPGCGLQAEDLEERNLVSACINVSIAVQNMVLAATSLGLGTCWVRAFRPEKVAELLRLPPEYPPLFLVTMGYAREDPEARSRKSLEDILL